MKTVTNIKYITDEKILVNKEEFALASHHKTIHTVHREKMEKHTIDLLYSYTNLSTLHTQIYLCTIIRCCFIN